MRSSKSVFLALIIFISSIISFAQTDSTYYKSQIQFNLINGYSLSYLNQLSKESAIRYRIDVDLSVSKGNTETANTGYSYNDSGRSYYFNNTTIRNDKNSQMIVLNVEYLSYEVNEPIARVYWGGGPYCILSRTFEKNINEESHSGDYFYSYTTERLNYSVGVGINGVIGIECFITQQISILGEYRVYANYSWGKDIWTNISPSDSEYKNSSENTNRGWNIGLNALRLGVAFRF